MKLNKYYHAAFAVLASSPLIEATSIAGSFSARCASLRKSYRPDKQTTVLAAEYLPKGFNFTNPSPLPECATNKNIILADVCRLRLNVSTSSTSSVVLETWMPADWEKKGQRFILTGNGGLSGCIQFDDMNYYASLGFAAAGHNNGHDGDTGLPFYNRPEVLKDYVYRATLVAAQAGKKAAKCLYDKATKYSYYIGCSTGGRQGLAAAQQFPEEFDGIIAGDPANDWNNLMSAFSYYWKYVANQQNPLVMTEEQWAVWSEEVIRQCDPIDGAIDMIIEDPRKCKPRPEEKLCGPRQTWARDKCLTSYQVQFLRKIYEPLYGNNGTFLYPGYGPGDELMTQYWLQAAPPQLAVDWFRYAVYNDPNWTIEKDFDFEAIEYNNAIDVYKVSAFQTDLSKLKATGHKLITYHGLQDGCINFEISDRYYDAVSRKMGLPSKQLDSFYRYFGISGMSHCAGGNGAWFIGSPYQYSTAPAPKFQGIDHDETIVMKMVKWVEKGIAPETILGRGLDMDGKATSSRNHCKYPKKSTYVGGDASKKTSWKCV